MRRRGHFVHRGGDQSYRREALSRDALGQNTVGSIEGVSSLGDVTDGYGERSAARGHGEPRVACAVSVSGLQDGGCSLGNRPAHGNNGAGKCQTVLILDVYDARNGRFPVPVHLGGQGDSCTSY